MPTRPPRPSTPLVTLAVLALTLAGCSSDDPAPATPPTTDDNPPQPRPPETFTSHGSTVVAIESNPLLFAATFPRIDFNVTANVTALLIELTWDDDIQDLDAFARAPVTACPYNGLDAWSCLAEYGTGMYDFAEVRDRGGLPGAPDKPSRVLAHREDLQPILDLCGDPCTFSSYPDSNQNMPPTAHLEWWNFVTVFYGAVPDDFTAIPEDLRLDTSAAGPNDPR